MENLIKRFNEYFDGDAKARIVASGLEITIGNQTLFISLPDVIGGSHRVLGGVKQFVSKMLANSVIRLNNKMVFYLRLALCLADHK